MNWKHIMRETDQISYERIKTYHSLMLLLGFQTILECPYSVTLSPSSWNLRWNVLYSNKRARRCFHFQDKPSGLAEQGTNERFLKNGSHDNRLPHAKYSNYCISITLQGLHEHISREIFTDFTSLRFSAHTASQISSRNAFFDVTKNEDGNQSNLSKTKETGS